jgi:putative endonuclease
VDNQNSHNSYYPDIGTEGERFVAQWLQQQGWHVLAQRWHCRWGELDVVAYHAGSTSALNSFSARDSATPQAIAMEPTLAFIEVKTRSEGNWDADGRLAVNIRKQAKIGRAAQMYLSAHPRWADCACRFDVAIVRCETPHDPGGVLSPQLRIKDYVVNAWDLF